MGFVVASGKFDGADGTLSGRDQDHESIDVGRVNAQNTWPAAVGGQLPGGDAPAESTDAETGALGGVGEGFELAAGLGNVRHICPKGQIAPLAVRHGNEDHGVDFDRQEDT